MKDEAIKAKKGGKKGRSEDTYKMRPALSAEARERQLTALAMDRAEERLRNDTASSQIITAFIKGGLSKDRMEMEIMRKQLELMDAKIEALKATQRIEETYLKALKAMRIYSGQGDDDEDEY